MPAALTIVAPPEQDANAHLPDVFPEDAFPLPAERAIYAFMERQLAKLDPLHESQPGPDFRLKLGTAEVALGYGPGPRFVTGSGGGLTAHILARQVTAPTGNAPLSDDIAYRLSLRFGTAGVGHHTSIRRTGPAACGSPQWAISIYFSPQEQAA